MKNKPHLAHKNHMNREIEDGKAVVAAIWSVRIWI